MQSSNNGTALHIEFFSGASDRAVYDQMDKRKEQLRGVGHHDFRRQKVGRNRTCPCGSGLKFKKCCIRLTQHV